MIFKTLAKTLLILALYAFASNLYATQEKANALAELSAKYLYEFDDFSLERVLSSDVIDDKSLVAMQIIENLNNEIFLQYYLEDEKTVFGKEIPKSIKALEKYSSDISYKGTIIGHLTIFVKNRYALELNAIEKAWLENNPTITAHNEYSWAPYNYNEDGKPMGFSIEYFNTLAKIAGFKVKYVTGSWDELLNMTYDGKLDAMINIAKTEERAKKLLYVGPFITNVTSIIAREDSRDITNIESLFGKKISVVRGFVYESVIRDRYPQIELIVVEDTLEALKAVLYGDADATLGKAAVAKHIMKQQGIKGLIFTADFDIGDSEIEKLNIAVRKDAKELQSILKKAMELVEPAVIAELKHRWLGEEKRLILSADEQKWLDSKTPLRYVYNPNWAPFEWRDELGNHTGMLSDIISIIGEISGINFLLIKTDSWSESIDRVNSRTADMYSAIYKEEDKNNHINYTKKSIYTTPYVLIARESDRSDYFDIKEISDKKIAILDSDFIRDTIKKDNPNLSLLGVKSNKDGFEMLRNSEIDIFITNAVSAKYFINKMGYSELKIASKSDYSLDLKIAIRSDYPPEVLTILDKAIDAIPKKEISDILYKWTEINVEKRIDWVMIGQIVALLSLVLLFLFFNNRKLKNMVKVKTNELQKLLDVFDKNVIASKVDKDGNIVYVSGAFCAISGFPSSELIGKPDAIINHQDVPKDIFIEILKSIQVGNSWECEIRNRKKSGDYYWTNTVFTPEYGADNKIEGYSAISSDITAKKKVEELSQSLESKVRERTLDLEHAKKEIEEMHLQTKSSIEYASVIQRSLAPSDDFFERYFSDYFIIWQPKDIVGGDIYLFEELRSDDECLLMVIDCTGHGVPGAFVTMIVKAIERQIVASINHSNENISPSNILKVFNKNIKQLLKQESSESVSNVGFDGGILYYNKKDKVVKYSGASTPLFYIEDDKLTTIKGSRHSVGYKNSDVNFEFQEHTIEAKEGMRFYISTDGFMDQNGGEHEFPFGRKRFERIIDENFQMSFSVQKERYLTKLKEYQKTCDRNDDITVVGFKI